MSIARWLLLVLLVWMYVEQGRRVYPTPETQSIFLKTHTPNDVLDRFVVAQRFQGMNGRGLLYF